MQKNCHYISIQIKFYENKLIYGKIVFNKFKWSITLPFSKTMLP
jgi:hypothetical protein